LPTAAEFVGGTANGSVAGWGIFKDTNASEVLLFAEIESVTDSVCWNEPRGDQFLSYLSSPRTFCGGRPELKMSPCGGDSGKLKSLLLIHLINFWLLQAEDSL